MGTRGEKTATRASLSKAVYQEVGLSRHDCAQLVQAVLDEISNALVEGESVKISCFGTFMIRHKGSRLGRNPRTGKEVTITPRRVLVFHPSNVLRALINDGAPPGHGTGHGNGRRRRGP